MKINEVLKKLDKVNESTLDNCDLSDLIEFVDKCKSLGDAVWGQVKKIADNNFKDINPNAIDLADTRLRGFNSDLDSILDGYYKHIETEEE